MCKFLKLMVIAHAVFCSGHGLFIGHSEFS